MQVIGTFAEMQRWSREQKHSGQRIGFVPTMGYLHRAHVSLMQLLRPQVDKLVVSIYVNPLQFGPDEDLDRYPSDPEGDSAACQAAGVDCLFMPPELYPDGFATTVSVHGLTDHLCGASRPGHMEGVATVCTRLFNLVGCDVACFGEKDFQQLMMIRRLVNDLALPTTIAAGPLVRDDDGVALSSRNVYLSDKDRVRARSLHAALFEMRDLVAEGQRDVTKLLEIGRARIYSDAVDYLEVMDAESLQPIEQITDRPARALVAAWYGKTHLLDNVALGTPLVWG